MRGKIMMVLEDENFFRSFNVDPNRLNYLLKKLNTFILSQNKPMKLAEAFMYLWNNDEISDEEVISIIHHVSFIEGMKTSSSSNKLWKTQL